MKKLISLIVLSSMSFAYAYEESVCEMGQDVAQVRGELDFVPEYFFKPLPAQGPADKRREVSIITRDGNVFYDMATGKYRRVPGQIDGTATPDGQFMVTPLIGLSFYDRDDVKGTSDPAFKDVHGNFSTDAVDKARTLEGVYQSVGMLPGSAPNKVYRAITDTLTEGNTDVGGLMYKDYSTKPGPKGPVFDKNDHFPKPLCTNLAGHPMKLPMLSKDGKMLAAYDVESGTTKIFNIKQVGTKSTCELKKDLGFSTAKVEFSPDGKKIVFASDSYQSNNNGVRWFEQPNANQNFNVYVVDMDANTVQRVSRLASGSAYYPSFVDNNSVVYMEQTTRDNGETGYAVVQTGLSNSEKMLFNDFSVANSCDSIPSSILPSMALGALWNNVCNYPQNRALSLQGLSYLSLALDPNKCQELVKTKLKDFQNQIRDGKTYRMSGIEKDYTATEVNVDKYYNQFLSVSESSLLAVCPPGGKSKPAVKTLQPSLQGSMKISGENKLMLCQQCHTSQFPFPIDFSDPNKLSAEKSMIYSAVAAGVMPKGSTMNAQERAKLLEWIYLNIPNP